LLTALSFSTATAEAAVLHGALGKLLNKCHIRKINNLEQDAEKAGEALERLAVRNRRTSKGKKTVSLELRNTDWLYLSARYLSTRSEPVFPHKHNDR
jgi:hypothetical protein